MAALPRLRQYLGALPAPEWSPQPFERRKDPRGVMRLFPARHPRKLVSVRAPTGEREFNALSPFLCYNSANLRELPKTLPVFLSLFGLGPGFRPVAHSFLLSAAQNLRIRLLE